jgi:HEAT repeat protein
MRKFSMEEWVRRLEDGTLSRAERVEAAEALVRIGTPEALTALKKAFGNLSRELRLAIVDSLGRDGSAEAMALLTEWLKDADSVLARAALENLLRLDKPEAASALVHGLNNAEVSADLRCQIAQGLGALKQPWTAQVLADAAADSENEEVARACVMALGELDYATTKDIFDNLLHAPDVSAELRVTALETLAGVEGNPTGLLKGVAAHDVDPDARAAAAWALSATTDTGDAAPAVLAMIQSEPDPGVRLRLYQALLNQSDVDYSAALALVQRETDPSARIAGFGLLAQEVRLNPSSTIRTYFDQVAVNELERIALAPGTLDDRQAAIVALVRANTPAALEALNQVRQAQANPSPQPTRR